MAAEHATSFSRNYPSWVGWLKLLLAAGWGGLVFLQDIAAADVILTGNYLRVGISNSGGLIDAGFTVGIDYSANGSGVYPGFDFLKPGTPFEFYSIGYGGSTSNVAGITGGSYLNPFGATTTNTSSGSIRSVSTTGGTYGTLAFTQNLSFAAGSGVIDFSVSLTNTGASALTNVVYARGLDPDQDKYAGGDHFTTNRIVGTDLVTAFAPVTGWTIGIFSASPISHTASVRSDWSTDPYSLLNATNDGDGDWTINMAWNIGTLAAGQSVTIPFQYRISAVPAVPEPSSYASLAGIAVFTLSLVRRRRN